MSKRPDASKPESDLIFEKQPSRRAVWLLPSILLHLGVIAVWFLMPNESKDRQPRKLIVSTSEAEQLQRFLEDANVLELRKEVARLQEIKLQIAAIRSVQIEAYEVFAQQTRSTVEPDTLEVLAGVQNAQQVFIQSQKDFVKSITALDVLFQEFQPSIRKGDAAALLPNVDKLIASRQQATEQLRLVNNNRQLLQASVDQADSVLSWRSDTESVKLWGRYIDSQEGVFVLQSVSSDQQSKLSHTQINALKRIQSTWPRYQQKLTQVQTGRTNYEETKEEFEVFLSTSSQVEQELEKDYNQLMQAVDDARGKLSERRKEQPYQKDEIKDFKAKRQAWSDDIQKLTSDLQQSLKDARKQEGELRKLKQQRLVTANRLKQLKPPSPVSKEQLARMMNEVEQQLNDLSNGAGSFADENAVLQAQEEARSFYQILVARLSPSEGGAQ